MGKVIATKVRDGKFAEDVIDQRSCILDRIIPLDQARGLKPGEGKGFNIFFQRNAILQAKRNGDGKIIHQ